MTTVTFTASGSWSGPTGVTSTDCQTWGPGGSGASGLTGSHAGGGGGGAEYAEETALVVHATSYTFTIGAGGSGTATSFPGDSVTVTAHAGAGAVGQNPGVGGTGSTNTIHFSGGGGGSGVSGSSRGGGGGGSSAGTASGGATGSNGTLATGGSGGTAPSGGGNGGNGGNSTTGGTAGTVPGGGGGGGGNSGSNHAGGTGAGGQITLTYSAAQNGTATLAGVGTLTAAGSIAGATTLSGVGTLTAAQSGHGTATLPGVGTMTPHATLGAGATLAGAGTMNAAGGLPNPAVVNQWANNYGQVATFGSATSTIESCVVPLTPAFSVGTGSGVSTEGNWLFCIASWTQDPAIANVHVGVSDDIHSWWRQYPAAGPGDSVRTSISYTPNIARQDGYVYCAPDGPVAAVNVLVVEIAGLGPWDTVAGTNVNYTAGGTSVSLSLSAPGQASFFIGGVGGDNTSSGQAFLPSGYSALATQTQTNGTDHTCDNILTAAYRPSSSASQSVSGTSSGSEDLSGFLLGVYVSGLNPVPGTQNPNWPLTKFEAAFGAGYNTPNSELTWTDLTNRLWSWDETTGIQYQLGQLQATDLNIEVDNFDGALTPSAAPWSFTATGTPSTHSFFTVTTAQAANISAGDGFTDTANAGTFFTVTNVGAPSGGNVNVTFTPAAATLMSSGDVVSQASLVAGTPVRLRMALGTMGGQVVNRWYVIQRNVNEWGGEVSEAYRRYCPVSATDMWAAMSSVPPTFYRAEIYTDGPGWWWPMDDQPLEGGVLPVTLLNAAAGTTTVMDIIPSPLGVSVQNAYGANGVALSGIANSLTTGTAPPPSVASYAVGANSGWMYGDPPSSASSFSSATGNPVESGAGSASWQQAGLLGTGGSNGWFLSATDTFPGLSSGVTVKGWFNCGFYGSASGFDYNLGFPAGDVATDVLGQPYSAITVATLATATAPVAILQLDQSGHLNLITYNGGTGTSHAIYSASDLRCGGWIAIDMTLTTTTWNVLVNGGLTANVSGTATGMTSAWTYLILDGDMGTSGGTGTSNIRHGGNMSLAHWAVFGYILPAWRLLAHYTAASTGFGLLPAPVVQLTPAISETGTSTANTGSIFAATPDGWIANGGYGGPHPAAQNGTISPYSFSMLMTANAGTYSSAPSARATLGGIGEIYTIASDFFATGAAIVAALANPNAPVYTVYTSAAAASETEASTILGSADVYTSGFGASAVNEGVSNIASGTGASPPAAATPLGDTVGQRIERLMNAGRTTSPQRSIDPSPPLVQAPGVSGGGTQMNAAVQAIQQSDSGLLFVDNCGNLVYWMRSHLAAQYSSPVWAIGPETGAGQVPYYREYRLVNDPQRIYNTITVQPFSPSGAQLPELTPTNAAGVQASQMQNGAQALPVTSWLQDQTVMQAQANWLFANFGSPQTRAENVRIDAAPYPAAWQLVAGISVADLVTFEEWQIGAGGRQLTLRVTEINRKLRFGGMNDGNAGEGEVVASVELVLDFEPPSYF